MARNRYTYSSQRTPAEPSSSRSYSAGSSYGTHSRRTSSRSSSYSRPQSKAQTSSTSRNKTVQRRGRTSGYERNGGSHGRNNSSRNSHQSSPKKKKVTFKDRFLSSRPAIIALIIVVVVAGFGIWDMTSNWGRAYGNVSINGVAVGGMDRQQMDETLKTTFGPRVSHSQISIYPDVESQQTATEAMKAVENAAHSAEDNGEDVQVPVEYWQTDALALKAQVPYEDAIDKALAIGREEGGFAQRFGLLLEPVDISLGVNFDSAALEDLAEQIDAALGDARQDTTIRIADAYATVVEGHDGTMVDRDWLADKLSWAMIMEDGASSFVAELFPAPSRITTEQAQKRADQVNHALGCDALFTYENNRYTATDVDLGNWTQVETVEGENGFDLGISIDSSAAIPAITKGAKAHITSEDTTVTFDKSGNDIIVYTGGEGLLPEVPKAVEELNDALYGTDGIAWSDRAPYTIDITIEETDKPEELTFDQAIDLEIVSVIGEYKTEFSNYVGTENRNHNIKLAADMLNNSIIKGDGGIWSFNDEAGDTNEEAGFWSAGSIVNGEIVDSIGGGICQVATTIFNAFYEAGLDIPTRHNHTLYMANYPDGRDAGINYPDIDLVWRNDLPSDILMRVTYTDTSITATLYSVYTGYTVESEVGEWEDGDKYKTRFEEDETLAKGAYYKKTSGEDGSKISVTRIVKDRDGNTIDFNTFASVYQPKDEIYCIGPGTDTKELERKDEDEDTTSSTEQ